VRPGGGCRAQVRSRRGWRLWRWKWCRCSSRRCSPQGGPTGAQWTSVGMTQLSASGQETQGTSLGPVWHAEQDIWPLLGSFLMAPGRVEDSCVGRSRSSTPAGLEVVLEAAWALTNLAAGEHEVVAAVLPAGPVLTAHLSSAVPIAEQCAWALGEHRHASMMPRTRMPRRQRGHFSPFDGFLDTLRRFPSVHEAPRKAWVRLRVCRGTKSFLHGCCCGPQLHQQEEESLLPSFLACWSVLSA
jgi:hypothetical protein